VDSDPHGRPYRVFDPCIWKEGDYYYSLSGGHLEGDFRVDARKADHIFRSKDLISWTYMGEFVENFRFPQAGDDGACPYFWPIGNKHILLTFSHRRAAQYIIGTYDKTRQRLIAQKSGNLNTGAVGNGSIHAPSAFPDGKGGVTCIYNINPGKPTKGWDQIMSLPRSYTLSDQGELLISPTGDYESLRTSPVKLEKIKLPANEEVIFERIKGKSLELKITIAPGPSRLIDLNVLRAPDKSEYTSIQLKREAGLPYGGWTSERVNDSLISIDTSYSSLADDVTFRGTETAEFLLEKEEVMELHVFIDQSVVEVFINGKQAILQRVYPDRADSMGVSLTSRGNGALCSVLEAWVLESIYD
jgi:beta-fructofuranosidase